MGVVLGFALDLQVGCFPVFCGNWFLLVCIVSLVLIVLLRVWFVVYVALAVCCYVVGCTLCVGCGERFVFR